MTPSCVPGLHIIGTNKAVAASVDSSAVYCWAHPLSGGKQIVCESWRNLISVGAKPIAITNCLNFGSPENEENMGEFVECVQGLGEASAYLEFPVVSGNVSFYNQTKDIGIKPTPAIGGVGLIKEYKDMIRDPSFLQEMESEQLDVFEIMVLYTIIFRRDVSYIVTVDGYCLPYVFDKHEMIKKNLPEFELLMKSPHIVLSLSQAYSQLIQEWSEKKWFNEVSIVSKDEKKILGLMRDQTTKELKIMKNKDGVERIILVKDNSINAIEEFANHIVRNGYQTITISTRQGKPVYFKNEVSINLKNIPD